MDVIAGAFAFLPTEMLSARKRGAAINPNSQGTEGDKKVFMCHDPTAQHPADRTDERLRDQALQGDDDLQAGIAHTSTHHACQLIGLISSHVLIIGMMQLAGIRIPCTPPLVK